MSKGSPPAAGRSTVPPSRGWEHSVRDSRLPLDTSSFYSLGGYAVPEGRLAALLRHVSWRILLVRARERLSETCEGNVDLGGRSERHSQNDTRALASKGCLHARRDPADATLQASKFKLHAPRNARSPSSPTSVRTSERERGERGGMLVLTVVVALTSRILRMFHAARMDDTVRCSDPSLPIATRV